MVCDLLKIEFGLFEGLVEFDLIGSTLLIRSEYSIGFRVEGDFDGMYIFKEIDFITE